MYEENEETGAIDFGHNPFSMPKGGLEALNNEDPLNITAIQYDFVCNGYEMSSGAVRNHDIEIMKKHSTLLVMMKKLSKINLDHYIQHSNLVLLLMQVWLLVLTVL